MRLNVGAGALRLPGFVNVDVRSVGRDAVRGHAGNLAFADDHSVDVVFSNAVFEHVYPAHRLAVLREWRRVLAPSGVIVCIGLPDFEAIARHYLERGPGTTGDHFDLYEVYRYTHGEPEHAVPPVWSSFDPFRHENDGPPGYVPQLHKGLFDRWHLSALLVECELPGHLITYAFPGEEAVINLGFVAGSGCDDPENARAGLAEIGSAVDQLIRTQTLVWSPLAVGKPDRTLDAIRDLESRRPDSPVRRTLRRGKRIVRAAVRR